mmetsp:Transcript_6252/g.13028  ORF Transcript_6252/g.13028 Transcript_6252/m.13028 type:complete len:602 (-) Transcript_6252:1989-3794(-)|eukprot:CAMPEP_0172449126 /NCGR_PEP_ID=MMETSP1065-20121228/7908_1 /TAXON_ID=265537 /ORGANISM="Amphiprora paludosa, Strain CCMP125" /LENGTH=601 /DNA_ID=CAMNT_0013200729 /DNA_START=145 /DNA_END=1950 /DNA_ORIENTATION=-
MSSGNEVTTLEQQLQEYRQKLAAYKDTGSVSGGSVNGSGPSASASVGGGNPAYYSPRPKVKRSGSGSNRSAVAQSMSNIPSTTELPPSQKSGFPSQSMNAINLERVPSTDHEQSSPTRDSPDNPSQLPAGEGEVLFNYDDDFDGGSLEDEPEEELTWRSDPAKSMSDWTINVTNRATRQKQVYHVHRNVLAVGKRKSEYFVRFFRSYDRLSKTGQSTDIFLETVSAASMPQLLDYMYSAEGKLDIATESAVGLRYLAQFFGMRGLHKRVMSFIIRNLNMDNLKIYYDHSVAVDDSKVSEIASAHCAKNIMSISVKHSLIGAVDPLFFRRIMLSDEIDSMEKQLHMSQLLAEFCVLHRKLLDDQDFIRLTDEQCLPHVHYKAALTLMEMEADLGLIDHEMVDLTSLQERCLRDIATHWEDLSRMKPAELTRICKKLPSPVVTEIMVRSLGQAKKRVDMEERKSSGSALPLAASEPIKSGASVASAGTSDKKAKRDYEAKVAELKREHQETLDAIKAEFEANLVKMREAVVEKDKYITEYWNELKRFERVSNQPEGKMVQSTPASAKLFKMPGIGNQPTEGLVLSKPKGGGKFPLFVYRPGEK